MKRKLTILLLLLLALLPAGAQAAEEEPAHEGYLVQLRQPVPALCGDDSDEVEVISPTGLYWTATEALAEEVFPRDSIAFVEPNYTVTLLDEPNDPLYGDQWALSAIGAESAWTAGLHGAGVRVGIIDSGVEADHEDLRGADILTGHDYLTDSDSTGDTLGHGTFVTGVIAAQSGNGKGVAGIADRAEIVPLKCFDAKTSSMDSVLRAIYDAVDTYRCDILNMSFGVGQPSQALEDAVSYAVEQGVIVTAAVGNEGSETLYYPAAFDGVIGVGAVCRTWEPAAFSNQNSSVFVTAPGEELMGLGLSSVYETAKGTSFACPMVTAAAALAKEYWPEMTGETLREVLAESAQDLGEPGRDAAYGYGLLDIPQMLKTVAEKRGLRLEQEGEVLKVNGTVSRETAGNLLLWAGQYDRNGRFLGVKLLTGQADPFGGYQVEDSLPVEEADTVRLFVLDEASFQPVGDMVKWEKGVSEME